MKKKPAPKPEVPAAPAETETPYAPMELKNLPVPYDPFELAVRVAKVHGLHRIVEFGCGEAPVLVAQKERFLVVGVDRAEVTEKLQGQLANTKPEGCADAYGFQTFDHDFRTNELRMPSRVPTLIVCATLYGRLEDARHLVASLRFALRRGARRAIIVVPGDLRPEVPGLDVLDVQTTPAGDWILECVDGA